MEDKKIVASTKTKEMRQKKREVSLSDLSDVDREELMRQARAAKESKDDDASRMLSGLERIVSQAASDRGSVRNVDPPKYFREGPDGHREWTFYVKNVTDSDVLISNLSNDSKREGEAPSVRIYARSGKDLRLIVDSPEQLKGCVQLNHFLLPGHELTRMTPEEWDAESILFEQIDKNRQDVIEFRKRKRMETNGLTRERMRKMQERQSAEIRASAPKRAKVVGLADRLRHGQVDEGEVIARVRSWTPLNQFEIPLLLEAVNELRMPDAHKILMGLTPRQVTDEEIEDQRRKIQEFYDEARGDKPGRMTA